MLDHEPDDRAKARLFVAADLAPGAQVALPPAAAHYLARVLRLRIGDPASVFNGRDGEWRACILDLARGAATLVIKDQIRRQASEPDLWLLFAPLKKTRTDFVIEKATELGVAQIHPVFTARTMAARVNVERLQAHAVEAAEQCERLSIPVVRDATPLAKALATWPRERLLFVLDETGAGRPLAEALSDPRGDGAPPSLLHAFLIGPEGGFERAELDHLKALPFVRFLSAGPRILRAETAAVAALACWQALLGDWNLAPRT